MALFDGAIFDSAIFDTAEPAPKPKRKAYTDWRMVKTSKVGR